MFGQQDTPAQPGNDMTNGAVPPPSPSMMSDMGVGGSTPPASNPVDPMSNPPSDPLPPMNDPVTPTMPDVSLPAPDPVTATPSDTPADSPAPEDTPTMPAPTMPNSDSGDGDNDLMSIKQQALQQLSPLVGHLDQTPEEKFRTTMMMIQASDDSSLLPQAYEAANQITDEKVKAQALLDVINEINYFTQQGSKS